MIDWWLLFSMNILGVSMGFHTYIAHLVTKGKGPTKKSGECLLCNVKGVTMEYKPSPEDTNVRQFAPTPADKKNIEKDYIEKAKLFNQLGKIIFVFLCVIFNVVFWSIATIEYMRPAEEYI